MPFERKETGSKKIILPFFVPNRNSVSKIKNESFSGHGKLVLEMGEPF